MIADATLAVRARLKQACLGQARVRQAGRGAGGMYVLAGAAAGLVLLPILAVLWLAIWPAENIWPHLVSTVLPRQIGNTVVLMLGNTIGVILLGVGTAWLVTMCRFPGARLFRWLLLLPLAMPAYIVAFVYTDLLEFAGPVQKGLRLLFGWQSAADYVFPEIRSLGGSVFVMSLVLYPYVFLLARAAFLEQSVCALEAGRVLGRGAWRGFLTIALPLARPAIAAGTALALMETLSDFGTVDFFGVNTLTRGVFNVWQHMGNAGGAAQLALMLLAIIVCLLWVERVARRRRRFHHSTARYRQLPGYPLRGARAAGAFLFCAFPVCLGFLLPAALLLRNALAWRLSGDSSGFFRLVENSLLLSGLAALAAIGIALLLVYGHRLTRHAAMLVAMRIAAAGYAIPGTVLAIGVLIPLAALDNAVDGLMRRYFGISTGLLLSGTLFAILFAYVCRFLAVAVGAVESGLGKIRPSMEMAARTLGASPGRLLWRLHLPVIRGSVLAGATIIFVDAMKELPATLLLRPFNFDTLATHVYQLASLELFEAAALPALAIVATGMIPVLLLDRALGVSRPGHAAGTPADRPAPRPARAPTGGRRNAPLVAPG